MNILEYDVLAVAVGSVVVDTVFLIMNYTDTIFVSKELTRWYTSLGPSAMAMDIIIILVVVVLGIFVANRVFQKPSIFKTAVVTVLIQLIHDVLFYILFASAPKGMYIFDIFKAYKDEVGGHALWSDSLMVIATLIVAENISNKSQHVQLFTLLISIYVALFALYSKKPTIG